MEPVDSEGNKRDLYFDTDCLALLEQRWKLSKKQVMVTSINFYFTDEKNKILTPLHKAYKRGTSGSKWKQAYQAVKHDRRNSLKKANIGNLIQVMGALFLLNLYYKEERTDMGRFYMNEREFDTRAGSDMFSVFCFETTGVSLSSHVDDSCIWTLSDSELEKNVYIQKYDDESFKEMHKSYCLDAKITEDNFNKSKKIAKFLEEHPEYKDKSINEICLEAGGQNLLFQIVCLQHSLQNKDMRKEVIINKHENIYPELFPLDE